jgi:hypothetical protein
LIKTLTPAAAFSIGILDDIGAHTVAQLTLVQPRPNTSLTAKYSRPLTATASRDAQTVQRLLTPISLRRQPELVARFSQIAG